MPALFVALQTYQPLSSRYTRRISRLPLAKTAKWLPVRTLPSLYQVIFVSGVEAEQRKVLVFDSSTVSLLGTSRNRGGAEKKGCYLLLSLLLLWVLHTIVVWLGARAGEWKRVLWSDWLSDFSLPTRVCPHWSAENFGSRLFLPEWILCNFWELSVETGKCFLVVFYWSEITSRWSKKSKKPCRTSWILFKIVCKIRLRYNDSFFD